MIRGVLAFALSALLAAALGAAEPGKISKEKILWRGQAHPLPAEPKYTVYKDPE